MALPMVMNILLLGFLALFAGQMSILAIREINAEMDDIQQLSQEQQAMLQEIRKGKKCEVNCEREIRNGKSIFTICRDVFPINHDRYSESANEQIGPFPVPRFPLHKKCSATNPSSSMPPSKLTITIGFPFSGNVACHSGFDICYASAFEGSTKMDLWEILELKNAGNDVAEKCNKNDNNGGIKWHGFRIVRKVEEENENGAKRLIITDSMEFSYRKKKRIRLNKGEFFHQLILTEIGLEVLTSSRNIYILEDGRIYDPEKDTNFGKRVDLANVDISSTQKIFYEFNHNASLWTVPFDMAIIDPSKYNVPIYGIPPADAKNLKISAMKAVYSAEECNIRPTFEIDDIIFKWEKVAPVVLNFTLLNGTESAFYYIKYGYLNFEKSVFNDGKILKKISYEIWKNLELSNILKEKKFDFSSLTGYEMGYHQISNEEYQNGVMVLKAKSFNTEIIYGWAEFDSAMAKANDNLAPDEFNWTNDFYLLNGCKHTTINLLSNLDKTRTHRALGKTESAEYNVEFVVGLSSNVAGFILTKEDVAFLELFHESIQNKEFDGQKILDDSHVFKLLKSLNLNAKFRQLNEDLMKTIIGDSSAPWELLEGEFGLFQEIYQCPNFRVNLPQVSGKIKFTFEDRNGEISTDFIGFSSKNVAINFIDSYTILNPMGKLECILNDVFNKNGRDIYYRGSGKCVI